jgi:hypothetical protein
MLQSGSERKENRPLARVLENRDNKDRTITDSLAVAVGEVTRGKLKGKLKP